MGKTYTTYLTRELLGEIEEKSAITWAHGERPTGFYAPDSAVILDIDSELRMREADDEGSFHTTWLSHEKFIGYCAKRRPKGKESSGRLATLWTDNLIDDIRKVSDIQWWDGNPLTGFRRVTNSLLVMNKGLEFLSSRVYKNHKVTLVSNKEFIAACKKKKPKEV